MPFKGKKPTGRETEMFNSRDSELEKFAGELAEKERELPKLVPESCHIFVERGFNIGDKVRRLGPEQNPKEEWEIIGWSPHDRHPSMEVKRILKDMITYSGVHVPEVLNGLVEKIKTKKK